jgi:hypothetical protein
VNVLVTLTSGFADFDQIPVSGVLEVSGNMMSVIWTQPPSGEETCESLHQLSFDRESGVLHMTRSGENTTDLYFSEQVQMEGILTTPFGEFSMTIETKQLIVSEKLWMPLQMPQNENTEDIKIQYFLHVLGQEPMQNNIIIQIGLEKKRK